METNDTLEVAFDVANEKALEEVLPAGTYTAFIEKINVGTLGSGKGQAINAMWCVEDGDYQGRLLFDRYIIQHESEKAMAYGRRRFTSTCRAIGINEAVTDLSVLLNKAARIRVVIETDPDDQYPPKNIIRSVKALATKKNDEPPFFNDSIGI